MKKPNILLIMTDTHRCDALGCMGGHGVSPNIDRLAAEGAMFAQAHTPSPVCLSARTSLMTGLHAPTHGCVENGVGIVTNAPMLSDLLREQGYYNVMVGKTHFGRPPSSFDYALVDGSDEYETAYAKHLRDNGYSYETDFPNVPEELFADSFLVDKTIAALNERDASRPFFAFCSLPSPHSPVTPPGRWAKLFEERELPPLNHTPGEEENYLPHMQRLVGRASEEERTLHTPDLVRYINSHAGVDENGREAIDALRRLYYGFAAYCDDQIGRLINYIDTAGLKDDTLVIFTTDHGQEYFDHGFNNKHVFYDASWRIPLVLRFPGVIPARERRGFASLTDVAATILEAAKIPQNHVQGFDLISPLKNGTEARSCVPGAIYFSLALATEDWKIIHHTQEGDGQLFNRKADPAEQNNLYNKPEYETVRDKLLIALLKWRAGLTDVHHMQTTLKHSGPVIRRLKPHIMGLKGTDTESALCSHSPLL